MGLRAVVFDFGNVLSGDPDPAAYAEMLRLTGLTRDEFEPLYWADRHAYDEGKLNGVTFWQKFLVDAGISVAREEREKLIADLNRQDAAYWTADNPRMVTWQAQLKAAGLKTAVLSNMGDVVKESIMAAFPWFSNFDHLTWSYELGIAKPDLEIYRHTLAKINVSPNDALFLDDKEVNIDAAKSLGMKALLFTDIDALKTQLIAAGFDKELPLPA